MGATSRWEDYISIYLRVQLLCEAAMDATILTKNVFRTRYSQVDNRGRKQLSCYDNGWFSDSICVQNINDVYRQIVFCGIGAYHQNAIVKRHIKEITIITRAFFMQS